MERLEGNEGRFRANVRPDEAVRALAGAPRADLTGGSRGAFAYLLADAARIPGAPPMLVVVRDLDAARRLAQSLRFFLGELDEEEEDEGEKVLVYPVSDTSPYLDVAPDRRAAMDRAGCLSHLALGLPFRFLIVPAAGLARRVPPKDVLASRSILVAPETELDRGALVRTLDECGYLRTPVVEDPGTYALRGGLVDVYPPHEKEPIRIELDDWLVTAVRRFDPVEQRTTGTVGRVLLHPVREAILGAAETALARERVRALCDHLDMPSAQARKLVDEVETGRLVYGHDALLPAFYRSLETLFDFLPEDIRIVLDDPSAAARSLDDELDRASADREARIAEKQPTFPFESSYVDAETVTEAIASRPHVVLHRVAFEGRVGDDEPALAQLASVTSREVLLVGAEDHTILVGELASRRSGAGRDDALAPLADRARAWLDEGFAVLFAARTFTQGERLISLLRGYDVPVSGKPVAYKKEIEEERDGRAHVVVGSLGDGFVLPGAAIAFVTEEEIFGSRVHKRSAKKTRRQNAQGFLSDLRELVVGDFVVHADHGVGRYLGLERKTIGQSAMDRFRGNDGLALEVLVIEYAGGDKLFLPVSRLGSIQKFSGPEGHKPKIDRLGGSTFAKSKKTVAASVKQLAEELLKLYAERKAASRDRLPPVDRTYAEFEATFPFEETPDQLRAIEDVLDDLDADRPMDRLVCGDVGFGKTEVAIRAAFRVAMSGRQVAVLCPTTVLAQQHFLTFQSRFANFPIKVASLSRFVDKPTQTSVINGLKDGIVDVVVGTHRLLSKDIHFKDLGLMVVDEEQRFGVTHKERMKKLRTKVDVLTLSATPIPRTLQLAIGGMRDLSLITTAPTDRRAVRTFACRWDDHVLKEAIERELRRAGQVFFVYNRIEGLYERAQRLQDLLPSARIAVAHGQMNEEALEQTMVDFIDGGYDILCSTAIIESGIDIPRANTMIIDRADTFGLSQLYQLRGRVGRSRERAYCYLVTPPPTQLTDEARARIEALERFTELGSGFQVASLDMELRGAGDLLGAEQSGSVSLVGFDLFVRMLEEAVAELEGQPIVHDIDPEVSIDAEHFLPDDYVDDIGVRLSLYKRLATAEDEDSVDDIAREMEDRFGAPPEPALRFIRAMRLKPVLRAFRIVGLEASRARVTLHLRHDTPLDPAKIMALVAQRDSAWKLSPDMKLTRQFDAEREGDSIDRASELLAALPKLVAEPS